MAAKKDFADLSPRQQKRYTDYYNRHPEGTLAEARGHKEQLKPPGPNATPHEEALYSYRYKRSSIALKETLGLISHQEAKDATSILKEMEKTLKKNMQVSPGKDAREYYKFLEENEVYFEMLEELGLGLRVQDIEKGAVYYHP